MLSYGEKTTPAILVAPLDWGLGHATRCVPIIKTLLKKDCTVLLAGEGKVKALLTSEFPSLPFLELEGYRISYAAHKWSMSFHLSAQVPRIMSSINKEREWLNALVKRLPIKAVISDNRYGLVHPNLHSVFITHQLRIKTPFGSFADGFLQQLNYRHINRFSVCWVPDVETTPNLAGELSHPVQKPAIPVRYIGPLSRIDSTSTISAEQYLLILLSGPEPQRSILEQMMMRQLKEYSGKVVLLRGLPGETHIPQPAPNIIVYNHLPAAKLSELLANASFVISRCGYSTVMDLVASGGKGIFIPTPGQTEQEYLARHLMQHNIAFCVSQDKFRLKNVLDLAAQFPYKRVCFSSQKLNDAVDELMNNL